MTRSNADRQAAYRMRKRIMDPPDPPKKRGPKPKGDRPLTNAERQAEHRARKKAERGES